MPIYTRTIWNETLEGPCMPDGEYRKLQVTGGSTMIVSLPKSWVRGNQLGKGDIVSIEELATGDLRISPMQGKDSQNMREH